MAATTPAHRGERVRLYRVVEQLPRRAHPTSVRSHTFDAWKVPLARLEFEGDLWYLEQGR